MAEGQKKPWFSFANSHFSWPSAKGWADERKDLCLDEFSGWHRPNWYCFTVQWLHFWLVYMKRWYTNTAVGSKQFHFS